MEIDWYQIGKDWGITIICIFIFGIYTIRNLLKKKDTNEGKIKK